MGIFDEIAGKAGLQGQDSKTSSLLSGVMELFSSRESGGLHGIVQSFQQKGLGDIISSWISTGENKPITPEQMREGLGQQNIQQLAGKAGMSQEEASSRLSQHLPGFIDRLTPQGTVPEGGLMEKGMELLKGRFS